MFKKGQAAMEYLMTYGWAILVVLIALGALFYLGVFNPTVPSTCQISAPFSCMDVLGKDGSPDTVTLKVGASGISSASIVPATGIQVNGANCVLSTPATGDIANAKNNPMSVICTSPAVSKGDKFSGTVTIAYTTSTGGLSHTTIGQFSGTVE